MNRRDFLKLLQASVLVFGPLKTTLAVSSEKGTGLVYEDLFLDYWLEQGHPESPDRLRSIMKLLEQSGLLQHLIRIQPKQEILTYPVKDILETEGDKLVGLGIHEGMHRYGTRYVDFMPFLDRLTNLLFNAAEDVTIENWAGNL